MVFRGEGGSRGGYAYHDLEKCIGVFEILRVYLGEQVQYIMRAYDSSIIRYQHSALAQNNVIFSYRAQSQVCCFQS